MANVEFSYIFAKKDVSSDEVINFMRESEKFVRTLVPAGADMYVHFEPAGHEDVDYHYMDIAGTMYGTRTYKEVSERLGSLQRMLHERFDLQRRLQLEKAVAAVAIYGEADNLRSSASSARE